MLEFTPTAAATTTHAAPWQACCVTDEAPPAASDAWSAHGQARAIPPAAWRLLW